MVAKAAICRDISKLLHLVVPMQHRGWPYAFAQGALWRDGYAWPPRTIVIEITAVVPEGRITPACVGLWQNSLIEPLGHVVKFANSQGWKIGI